MINKLFKKPKVEDLLAELKNNNFKESTVNSMLKHININHINQNQQNFLHIIIIDNKIESVKWLISKNININEKDSKGMTPLMLACKYGFEDAVDELLKVNVDVNLKNTSGYRAIEFAVFNKYFNIYKKLKPFEKDINSKNKKGFTLLHTAIQIQNYDVIDDLFRDKNFTLADGILFFKETYTDLTVLEKTIDKFRSLDKVDAEGRSILFYVIENGIEGKDIFLKLLDRGLNINHIDKKGNNILLHLLDLIINYEMNNFAFTPEEKEKQANDIENLTNLIQIILDKGIDTTICNKDNETALSMVAKSKNIELLKLLLDNQIDINIVNNKNETAINNVITKGPAYLDTIYMLLDYGINPNIKDENGITVIEKIIDASLIARNLKKVKTIDKREIHINSDYLIILESVLVNTDINLHTLNSKGEPFYFEAFRYNALDIVKLLFKYGADVNQLDNEDTHIIFKYMEEKHNLKRESELKEYYNNLHAIINMGANVNAKDSFGGITLHKAILNKDTNVIKILLHSGADINAIDNRGRHILHNAVWKNDKKIFRLVFTYTKKLLNEPDKFGVLPINYAAFLGYTDLVLEFIELNAHVNNPYRKTHYILNFLKKFHKNLDTLQQNARTKVQKSKLRDLIENMKKEFEVIED